MFSKIFPITLNIAINLVPETPKAMPAPTEMHAILKCNPYNGSFWIRPDANRNLKPGIYTLILNSEH